MYKQAELESITKSLQERPQAISAATKTGLSSVFNYQNHAPFSLLSNPHYCENATSATVGEFLRQETFEGIIIRPSSSNPTVTTVSYLDKDHIKNHQLSNSELHQLNNSFKYYGLNLGVELIELTQQYREGKIHAKDFSEHVEIGLKQRIQDEINARQRRIQPMIDAYLSDSQLDASNNRPKY